MTFTTSSTSTSLGWSLLEKNSPNAASTGSMYVNSSTNFPSKFNLSTAPSGTFIAPFCCGIDKTMTAKRPKKIKLRISFLEKFIADQRPLKNLPI